MMPETRTPDEADIDRERITPTRLFAVFAHERRQLALAYLTHRGLAIPLGDLAEYIAVAEGEPTYERYERVCTDLYHSHLPRMVELGLVTYDTERELVELNVDRTVVTPYLDLAGHLDA